MLLLISWSLTFTGNNIVWWEIAIQDVQGTFTWIDIEIRILLSFYLEFLFMFLLALFQAPLKMRYKLLWLRDPRRKVRTEISEGKEISDFRCTHRRNSRLISSIEVSLVWSFLATSRESIAVCLAPPSKLPLPIVRHFRLKRWLCPLFSPERAKSSPFRALSEYASKLIDEARYTRPHRSRGMLPPGKFLYSSLRAERAARRPSKSFIESCARTHSSLLPSFRLPTHSSSRESIFEISSQTHPATNFRRGFYCGTLADSRRK